MPRATNSVATKARKKRVLKQAKGFFGRRKNVWTVAKNAVEKAMVYATVIENKTKEISVLYGLRVSTLVQDYTV